MKKQQLEDHLSEEDMRTIRESRKQNNIEEHLNKVKDLLKVHQKYYGEPGEFELENVQESINYLIDKIGGRLKNYSQEEINEMGEIYTAYGERATSEHVARQEKTKQNE